MTRCFVVGNGPSLKHTNLNKLKDDVSFGVNRVSLIYPHTDWRPAYYVRSEEANTANPETYLDDMRLHIDELKCQVWCNMWFLKNTEFGKNPNVHILYSCTHYSVHYDDEYCPHLWHFPRICTFGSSVNVAVQIAVREGYSPIYLVGCDLSLPGHFDEKYAVGLNSDHHPNTRYQNMDILTAHIIAQRSSPVPIFNATIGGNLEAYERVDFDALF